MQTQVMEELDKRSWPSQIIIVVLTQIEGGGKLEDPVHLIERLLNYVFSAQEKQFVRLNSEKKRRLPESSLVLVLCSNLD